MEDYEYHEVETVAHSSSGPKAAIVPPILVLATSEGTSSKLTTLKPNTPTSRHKLMPPSRVNDTHHTLTSQY
jgi:hypothetical protein